MIIIDFSCPSVLIVAKLPRKIVPWYEIKPDQPAPVAVACRDAKSNPCFTRTVVLQITSMGNLSEK